MIVRASSSGIVSRIGRILVVMVVARLFTGQMAEGLGQRNESSPIPFDLDLVLVTGSTAAAHAPAPGGSAESWPGGPRSPSPEGRRRPCGPLYPQWRG